jgi:mannosyltransferase
MTEEIDLEDAAPWLVLFITLGGAILRVLLLGTKGMWLDETFSVWMASHSVVDMLHWIVRIDQHPPLYYLLLHFWIPLNGEAPYYDRLLSVLFGTATIPIIYLIGKRISGIMAGVAAAAFLALNLFNIYYAQETRMYTLLAFNAAVAIYALVRLLTDPRSVRPIGSQFREYLHVWRVGAPVDPESEGDFRYKVDVSKLTGWKAWIFRHHWSPIQAIETDLAWVAFIVFSTATLLSHNTAVFFVLAINIFVLGLMFYQSRKKSGPPPSLQAPSLANWVKSQIGIFLLWSPWIYFFVQQASQVYQDFWIPKPTWDIVIHTLQALLNASAPGLKSQVIIMWILCAVLCLGLVHFRKNIARFLFLATLFAVPILGELIVSIRRPIFYDRTLIWITIPMILVLAAGIAQLKFRLLILAVLGILCANNLFSTSDFLKYYQKEDWATPAGYVAYFAQKDDLVLFNSNFVEISFNYYFKPYEDKYYIQVEKQGVPLDLIADGVLEPKMTTNDIPRLVSFLSGHNRVWLVYSHDWYTDPKGLIPQTLAAQMKLTKTREFYGGKVLLYETP